LFSIIRQPAPGYNGNAEILPREEAVLDETAPLDYHKKRILPRGVGMSGTCDSISDARLAGLVHSGDPEAFAQLSARYLGLVRGKARLFEGQTALDREDLWQEGFLGLYAAATSFDPQGPASFATYASACVYRRMVSAVRRQGTSGNRS